MSKRKFQLWVLSICSVIDMSLFHSLKYIYIFIYAYINLHVCKSPKFDFAAEVLWSFSLIFCLLLAGLPLLIQILARYDATDHTREYWLTVGHPGQTWRPVSTLGGIGILFCSDTLAPQQGKGHTWKDSECLSGWGINSYPDCHIQRPHCLSLHFQKPSLETSIGN